MDGLLSAVMAAEGITSSAEIIEGARGFLAVMSPDPAPEKLLDGLGEQWHLLANGYKAYPSGSLTHPAIDAVLALRAAHGFVAADVVAVRATVNPKAATVTGKVDPRTGLDAKFSITHGIAVALADRPRLDHFTDVAAVDAEIASARSLIDVRPDEDMGKRAAAVTVELADGRSLTTRVESNLGTPANPMSDDDLAAKFIDNAGPRLGDDGADRLLGACWTLDAAGDFAELVRMTGARS
jgi:2-methylcitrate dehydratase PrpD